MLVGEIVAGTNDSAFDLTGDSDVDINDRNQWLTDAATANGFAEPYSLGDANLDGTVSREGDHHVTVKAYRPTVNYYFSEQLASGREFL